MPHDTSQMCPADKKVVKKEKKMKVSESFDQSLVLTKVKYKKIGLAI